MKYVGTAASDVGIVKRTNQDSICLKIANTAEHGQIVMAAICDGMGGLEKGEVASASVIRACSDWFDKVLPVWLTSYSWNALANEWDSMIKNLNYKIIDYGKKCHVNLGTTVTVILIIEAKYMIVHVGDTRVYEINNSLNQLTEDQTYIAQEIKLGNMTEEQAEKDSRRNMLLQCVGASKTVSPEITFGEVRSGTVFLLCSDGFRHVLTKEEIYEQFKFEGLETMEAMEQQSQQMIEMVKQRKERDNISVVVVKCTE